MKLQDNKEWNLIMQLQEKIDQTHDKIDEVAIKIEKIQTLIRDYNGLRDRIDLCEAVWTNMMPVGREKEPESKHLAEAWLSYGAFGATAALLSLWWR